MKRYEVTWKIDIYADTPQEAAKAAQEIQRREDTTATVFEVWDEDGGNLTTVDLLETNEGETTND